MSLINVSESSIISIGLFPACTSVDQPSACVLKAPVVQFPGS